MRSEIGKPGKVYIDVAGRKHEEQQEEEPEEQREEQQEDMQETRRSTEG